jgi:ABC-type sugar transport system ATPase subunit
MARIALRDVSKSYGSVNVIKNVSLDIGDGELLVLVGPSGCGKSTLLRMIAGLEEITGGEIAIDDVVVNDIEPQRRDIAMVFQSYALYPHKTVYENITFGLKMRGMPKAEMRQRAESAAATLGLVQYLDRYPRQLSGGQRQRVAMGRALVREPKAFLFDEPLSNLDAQLRVQMRMDIRELQQQLGVTSVYVTHDQIEAMTLGDRIAVMHGGHVAQIGTPLDIYDRPANLFVATFIGSPAINLIDVTVAAGGKTASTGDIVLAVPQLDLAEAQVVVAGIRPEAIRISKTGFAGRVELVEQTGLDTLAVVSVGGHSLRVLARERVQLARGEVVHLEIDPEKVHFFDKGTGNRLVL